MTSIVLITGASGGIGRALAHQLHSKGLRVAVVGRDMDRLTDVDAALRSAAATYAAQGLRINAVAPGLTDTRMTANMLKMAAMREGDARQYPLGGIQSAEQVADVMAFLLGDGAARLTGQVIAVDGGFTTVRPLVR